MEEAAKVYLEAKDKNDTRTLDKLKNRFDGFQKIEDFITKKNQEQENAASLAAIQDGAHLALTILSVLPSGRTLTVR